ncbi:MAG: transporter substrate-binding domain-containing protein [Synechocystis sp.]|nr:transporter substrate-binding domain-containing protein [Synechocystis sp.]
MTPIRLKVGVAGAPPFVIYGDKPTDPINGISLDVWRDIAGTQGWESEYVPQQSVSEALQAVADGRLDILVGSISITPERVKLPDISFTQPYFGSSVGVMIPQEQSTLWNRVAPFFGITALSSAGILTLLLFIVGNLIWLAEHRQNPDQFAPKYSEGLQNGMWFALVTLTTVGYGDRSPKTKVGQLIASVWMIVALLSFSSITAGLASAFTAAMSESTAEPSLQTTEDIKGKSVAVVADTTAVGWANFYQAEIRLTSNLEAAVTLLRQNQVDAVMFDRPVLIYYANQNPDQKVRVTEIRIALEPYGFVLPVDSPLEKRMNVQLLNLVYSKDMAMFIERWLGKGFPQTNRL